MPLPPTRRPQYSSSPSGYDPIAAFLATRPDLEPDDIRLPPSARRPVVKQVSNCTHRLATVKDVPDLAVLAYKIFRTYPDQEFMCRGASREEVTLYMASRFRRALKEPAKRMYVAIDPADGAIVGYLLYSVVRKGGDEGMLLPSVRLPDGANHEIFERKARNSAAWTEEMLQEYGPHVRGDILGVEFTARRNYIATGLCKVMADEAVRMKLPAFIETCYISVPFYENFCDKHGLKLRLLGNAALDKQSTVISYRFQVHPWVKPLVEPEPTPKRSVPFSQDPDWDI